MPTRRSHHTAHSLPGFLTALCVLATHLAWVTAATQPPEEHLSPLIAKLAAGDLAFGVSTYDLSLENARSLGRSDLDYVYVDMEHGPMDFVALQTFLLGLTDRAAVAEQGSVAQTVTPLVRLAPYGRESPHWAAKQALDIGVMGLIFPAIETADQARRAVQSMRYPQRRDARYPEPRGLRGSGPTAAAWFWGLSTADYVRHADTWPLNPAGDLVALMMIESTEAVRNVEAIAAVPGVAGFYLGPSDLSNSLGVARDDPGVEAAIQTVVDACVRHGIACGITASEVDMPRRIAQGFTILGGGRAGGGLPTAVDAALSAGRAARD
ncbi:MAG: aldolase/citrate lyase family protein [Acidobacteriota bacterium]|nr:aldolase/citrate lyase family protein [Acidobacteriota bacterium]